MKTERRHELQHNTLADTLGTVVEGVKPYQQIILGCILAVVVVFGVVRYLSIRSQANDVESWNSYLRASTTENLDGLSDVVERHPGSPAAMWSNLYIADQRLERGLNQLFINKLDAKDELEKAKEAYLAVQAKATDPLLQQRATLGLGRVYESLVDLDKARAEYTRLKEKWPDSVYAGTADKRLADLSEQSTKQFYDWFASHEPRSQTPEGPGTPGTRLPFDLDNLPDQPDLGPGATLPSGDSSETKDPAGDAAPLDLKPANSAAEPADKNAGEKDAAEDKTPTEDKAPASDKTPADEKSADQKPGDSGAP